MLLGTEGSSARAQMLRTVVTSNDLMSVLQGKLIYDVRMNSEKNFLFLLIKYLLARNLVSVFHAGSNFY